MEDQLQTILEEVRNQALPLQKDRKEIVEQYLLIVEATLLNQGKIMTSYEGLTKKLETQIGTCQLALDESTKRELEQLQMIMQLKLAVEEANQAKAIRRVQRKAAIKAVEGEQETAGPKACTTCKAYKMENELLNEQSEKQQEVIDKLS